MLLLLLSSCVDFVVVDADGIATVCAVAAVDLGLCICMSLKLVLQGRGSQQEEGRDKRDGAVLRGSITHGEIRWR